MKKILLRLTGLKVISSFTGLLYSILQVRYFGVTASVDAFVIATTAVYTITSLIQGGQLSEILLPEYLKQKAEHGAKAAHNLLSAVLNRMFFFVTILLAAIFVFSDLVIDVIGPGLAPDSKVLASQLFSISLVLILFTIISAFVNTALNAEQIFGRAELTGIINSLLSIAVLVCFHEQFGVHILVYALLAGKIVEFTIALYFLKRAGYIYRPIWKSEYYNVTTFFRVIFTTSSYAGATQLYSVTMTAMASYLPAGSLSVFSYVNQLSTKAYTILMGPVSTVFFSKFSEYVSKGLKDFSKLVEQPVFYILNIFLLLLFYIALAGKEILILLWSSKSFDEQKFDWAYAILILNFAGCVFYSLGYIFRRTVVAFGKANVLYRRWIYVQFFSTVYSVFSIYFCGKYGLASILIINMVLISYVSYSTSIENGVESNKILKEIISNRRFQLFYLWLFSIGVMLFFGINQLEISIILGLVIKTCCLALLICILGIIYFKNEARQLLKIPQ